MPIIEINRLSCSLVSVTGKCCADLIFTHPRYVFAVKMSPYMKTDSVITNISLLMPATLNVTVLVPLIKYSSDKVIKKATTCSHEQLKSNNLIYHVLPKMPPTAIINKYINALTTKSI